MELNSISNEPSRRNFSRELLVIEEFYGDQRANRSGVLKINHIHEGLAILDALNASDLAKKAFCLHPIVQNSEPVDVSWSDSFDLAVEYRDRANSYLCRPETDYIQTMDDLVSVVGSMSDDCVMMLYADKVQNRKDFRLFHQGAHPRSDELTFYFDLWIDTLLRRYWVEPGWRR